jgi:hypothetical protein
VLYTRLLKCVIVIMHFNKKGAKQMRAAKQGLPMIARSLAIIMIIAAFLGLRSITMGYSGTDENYENVFLEAHQEAPMPAADYPQTIEYAQTLQHETTHAAQIAPEPDRDIIVIGRPAEFLENSNFIPLNEPNHSVRTGITFIPLPEPSPAPPASLIYLS